MMKGSKSIERSNSSSKSKKTVSKDGLPPISTYSNGSSGEGTASKSNSRSATPVTNSTQILPPIRPVSATKVVDSTTRVQLQGQLRDKSGTSDPEHIADGIVGIDEDQLLQNDFTDSNQAEQELEDMDARIPGPESDTLLTVSSDSKTEIEDPEKHYWRTHSGPPKNSSNVAKEALKRIQTALTSKKMDLSEMDLMAIPEKVPFNCLDFYFCLIFVFEVYEERQYRFSEWMI
jgi:hypothetical protein